MAMLPWPMVELLARFLSRPHSPFEVVWVRYGIRGPFAVTMRRAAILPLLIAGCFAPYLVLTRFRRDETPASRRFYTALGVWVPLGLVVPWSGRRRRCATSPS